MKGEYVDLKDFINAYKDMMSNRYGGFVILSNGEYYMKFSPTYDTKNNKIFTDTVIVEAVSHYDLHSLPDYTKEFKKIGFEFDEQSGRFCVAYDTTHLTDEDLEEIINNVFSIYGVKVPPYDFLLYLFDSMPDEKDLIQS